MKKLPIYILMIVILTPLSCTKDLPCTFDRYIGNHMIKSRSEETKFASIRRGDEGNQIIFNAGSGDYIFVIDRTDTCQATYDGDNFGLGLLHPSGDMTLYNKTIDVTITNYFLVFPLKTEYTLIL